MAVEDISTLVLAVKSDGIKEGTDGLNELAEAAKKAEGAAKVLATSSVDSSTKQKSAIESLLKKMEQQVALLGANVETTNAYKAAAKGATDSQVASAAALGRSVDAWKANEAATKAAAKAQDDAAASAQKAAARMAEAADRAARAEEDRQKRVQQARDTEIYNQNAKAYATAHAEALKMNKALDDNTSGHHGNAAAIREVMVLMHELSQGSFKRFGGSLMVLSNQLDVIPTAFNFIRTASIGTIASFAAVGLGIGAVVAGIGMLIVGTIQGHREMKQFNDALLQTGNFAGTTADGLRAVAKEAAGVHGNIGVAKEAVLQLAQSGMFTAGQMKVLAESATLVEAAFGVSTKETIKQFEELATLAITNTSRSTNVIAQHAMKLNDHYHFLTTAQYEYIVGLEKEGKSIEAAQFAAETFAKVQKERAEESLQNLGYVATAWHGIKNAISGAMDAIGKWGATKTLEDQMVQLQRQKREQERLQVTEQARKMSNANFDKAIAALQVQIDAQKNAALEKSRKELAAQEQMHAENRLNNVIAMNDKEFKKNQELAELDQAWERSSADYKLKNLKSYQTARDKIIKDSQIVKPTTGIGGARTDYNTEVDAIKAAHKEQSLEYEEFIRNSKGLATKMTANEQDELRARDDARQKELQNLSATLTQELAVYQREEDQISKAVYNKATQRAEALAAVHRKEQAARDEYSKKSTLVVNAGKDDAREVAARELADNEKIMKQIAQKGQAETDRLQKQIKAEQDRVAAVGQLKSVAADYRAQEEDAEASMLQKQRDGIQQLLDDNSELYGPDQIARLQAEALWLDKHINQHKTLAKLKRDEADADRKVEAQERMTKNLDEAVAAAKRFEKAMHDAFGTVGQAIGGVAVAFAQMNKDRDTAQVKFEKAGKDELSQMQAKKDLEYETTQANLNGYATMASAAAGMFNQQSQGYKTLMGISQVFHAMEMAQSLERMFAKATEAVLTQGTGDPYTAFGRMAAMAAVVAALGFAVGGGLNKSAGGKSAEEVQKAQGTGTVFGDVGTKNADGTTTYKDKSESIVKALDAIKDNADTSLPYTQQMAASLRNIETAMTGLTNLVFRTTGMTDGSNFGIKTGTLSRPSLGGAVSGILGGAAATSALGLGISGIATAALNVVGFGLGAIGGLLLNKLVSLWGSTKQEIVDSGITMAGTVSQLAAGQGYNQYASVNTTKSSWFGLSKSTTNSVQSQGLSAELSQQFGLIFGGLEDTLKSAASALGQSSTDVGNAIDKLVINTQVSLKGLSGQDLQNAINGVVSATMDQIAQAAFPQMGAFRQVGEGYAQTVIRVASGVEQAQVALKSLGVTAINFMDIQNKTGDVAFEMVQQSIALKEAGTGVGDVIKYVSGSVTDLTKAYKSLVDIRSQMKNLGLGTGLNADTINGAGGTDSLTSSLKTYYDKYFTTAEQAAVATAKITDQFSAIGKTVPQSREQLRSWIETAAKIGDQKQLGQLVSLADAFDQFFAQVHDDATKAELDAAQKAYDDAMNAADTAFSRLQKAVQKQKDIITASMDATKKTLDGLNTIMDSLNSALKATSPQAVQSFSDAMDVVRGAISAAHGGKDIGSMSGLADAFQTLSNNKTDAYSTLLDYQRAQAKANAALQELKDAGQVQVDVAQATLDAEQAQLDALDKQLDAAQAQLDALRGIDDSVLSVADALRNFQVAVGNASAAKATLDAVQSGGAGSSSGVSSAVESLYKTLLGRSSDEAGKAFFVDAILNRGSSITAVSQAIMNSDEYKSKLPSFDVGTNDVPEDMIAQIHKGERIIPAADNAELKQRLKDSDSQASSGMSLDELKAQVAELSDSVKRGDVATVQKFNELYKLMLRWETNGMPQTRSTDQS